MLIEFIRIKYCILEDLCVEEEVWIPPMGEDRDKLQVDCRRTGGREKYECVQLQLSGCAFCFATENGQKIYSFWNVKLYFLDLY